VRVDGLEFGLPVLVLRRVVAGPRPAPVPLAPHAVAGHLNLHGRAVPALDLGRRLALGDAGPGGRGMAVVAEQDGEACALLVDQVGELVRVSAAQFEPAPATLPAEVAACTECAVRVADRLLPMLSVPHLLALSPQA
jgi:purine-binding chemotaxis protein CheW